MNHIDVFSGIGGFAYATREVWGKEYHNILFCDNNKFCQEVIKKNFGKESLIYGDIREITRERVIADTDRARGRTPSSNNNQYRKTIDEKRKEQPFFEPCRQIDLLTGGFPCQPFSCAGKRRGTDDNRYLWPEMLRVIKEFKPTWVIAENVRGLLTIEQGLVFEQVCADLEGEGYEVQAFIIPAVAVNAPHRRDRVWVVAHSGHRNGQRLQDDGEPKGQISCSEDAIKPKRSNSDAREKSASNTKEQGLERWSRNKRETTKPRCGQSSFEQDWLEVATHFCGMDDGLPVELDGFKLTKAGHRVERLKALGNAIVPQVAIEIMKAIKLTEILGDL